MKKEWSHLYAHLRRARRLLELYSGDPLLWAHSRLNWQRKRAHGSISDAVAEQAAKIRLYAHAFVVRLSISCPFHYMALRNDEIKFVRVECACHGKKLTCDPSLLITMPVPAGATKEVWFLPANRKAWQIRHVPAQLDKEWQKLYSKN